MMRWADPNVVVVARAPFGRDSSRRCIPDRVSGSDPATAVGLQLERAVSGRATLPQDRVYFGFSREPTQAGT
jgi:hypothetical protein